MSPLTEPTKLTLRKSWQPMDPDAAAYITAVETADGQALEEKTKIAIDNFVIGCKGDGIWSAIKASCILAGARTLSGALVPLVGAAPTNVGPFVSGDYNRKTGLKGNGSTKYLNSNRELTADPQNNHHMAVRGTYDNTVASVNFIGARVDTGNTGAKIIRTAGSFSLNTSLASAASATSFGSVSATIPAFLGLSRSASGFFEARVNGLSSTLSVASTTASTSLPIFVFSFNNVGAPQANADGRLTFYSIGESLNLALLDARVTDLINAIGAAIP